MHAIDAPIPRPEDADGDPNPHATHDAGAPIPTPRDQIAPPEPGESDDADDAGDAPQPTRAFRLKPLRSKPAREDEPSVRVLPGPHPARVAAALFAPLGSWLLLLSGLALVGAMVLIPARQELDAARAERDRALAAESVSRARIDRHERYLTALDTGDETLIEELAVAHLRLVPADREVLLRPSGPGVITVERSLEPPAGDGVAPAPAAREPSTLERISTNPRARLITLALAITMIVLGLALGHPKR